MKKVMVILKKIELVNVIVAVLILVFVACDIWMVQKQLEFGIGGWYWLAPIIFGVLIAAIIYGWLHDTIPTCPTWKANFKS